MLDRYSMAPSGFRDKTDFTRPMAQPAWVAQQIVGLGMHPALSLYAHGLLAYGGFGSGYDNEQADDAASAAWTDIAESWDVVGDLRSTWNTFVAHHPWSRKVMWPLANALDDASDIQIARVRQAAETLAGVSAGYTLVHAGGDPLGHVYSEVVAQANRYREPHIFTPTMSAQMDVVMAGLIGNLDVAGIREWRDAWCGSGTRVVGVAAAIRRFGGDPQKVTWYVSDPGHTTLSLAAVNFAFYGLGKRIRISHDEETFQRWLAARAQGLVPASYNDLGTGRNGAMTAEQFHQQATA